MNRTVVWIFKEDSLKGTDPVGRYILSLFLLPPPYTVDVMAGTPTATLDYEVILMIEDSTENGIEKWESRFLKHCGDLPTSELLT